MEQRIQVRMRGGLIAGVALPPDFLPTANSGRDCPEPFASWYDGWFSGTPGKVDAEWFDLSPLSPFRRAVLNTLISVPRGRVLSYRQLATRTGSPNAIRATASVMANNPFPLIIPCHRVVRSDRQPGGYSRENNNPVKSRLLAQEGIHFDSSGHILPEYFIGTGHG